MLLKFGKRKIRLTGEDVILGIVNYGSLTLFSLVCVLPFLYILGISFTADEALAQGIPTLIPRQFSVYAYEYAFKNSGLILRGFFNSVLITVCGTLLGLTVMTMCAYALSRKNLPGRKGFLLYVLFAMLIGGGFIPHYLVIKKVLGMSDTYWALIIPGCYSAWNMIIIRNFFQTIPESLNESAQIDGANDLRIFVQIVLPLSTPVIAAIGLFVAVGYWNAWMAGMLYVKSDKYPLMLILRIVTENLSGMATIEGAGTVPPSISLQMAVVVIVMVPIMLVYPFLQKYFAKGMMIGSIKG
ncbi:MAG: carbohydrate ABC transporter permease [Clostridiales bacterium]|jgi:putative aldouronate transport system permease protein|nr:carbohydrate ABC transporter permease [Clostridiales bacterium]